MCERSNIAVKLIPQMENRLYVCVIDVVNQMIDVSVLHDLAKRVSWDYPEANTENPIICEFGNEEGIVLWTYGEWTETRVVDYILGFLRGKDIIFSV